MPIARQKSASTLLGATLGVTPGQKQTLTQHRLLGLTRIVVMEHDANCSPVLDGEFDSAQSLLEALRKNAA